MKAFVGPSIAIFLTLAGCGPAPAPWTREDQAAATTRNYGGVTPSTLRAKAEQVIRLTDPNAVRFEYTDSGFNATRSIFVYAVITAITGDYQYTVRVGRKGSGSTIEFKAFSNLGGTTTAAFDNGSSVFWDQKPLYDLFFARLDYLLGNRDGWITCKDAPAQLNARAHQMEPLCVGARDATP